MSQDLSIPVIAIDGAAGTGKGTVRSLLARELGFHSLDSGVLYRLVALTSLRLRMISEAGITAVASNLEFRVDGELVFLNGEDVTKEIRTGEVDLYTSYVAEYSGVRRAILGAQIAMRKAPGLVADGRDMGKIFDTPFRFYLIATPEERARRRVLQQRENGGEQDYSIVLESIRRRDERDRNREQNPLKPHKMATIINTERFTAEEVAGLILTKYRMQLNEGSTSVV